MIKVNKILIVAENSDLIKDFAGFLSVKHYEVFISNNLTQAETIFEKKKPDALLVFFNYTNALQQWLSYFEIVSKTNCQLIINNLSHQAISFNHNPKTKVWEHGLISKNDLLAVLNGGIRASTTDVLPQHTEYRSYNYTSVVRVLKNDKTKIKLSIDDFIDVVEKAKNKSEEVLFTHHTEELRPFFHNLLSLCSYFGANELEEYVEEFRKENKLETKLIILKKILPELYLAFKFYSNLNISE